LRRAPRLAHFTEEALEDASYHGTSPRSIFKTTCARVVTPSFVFALST
jgi:hypothetical protein